MQSRERLGRGGNKGPVRADTKQVEIWGKTPVETHIFRS